MKKNTKKRIDFEWWFLFLITGIPTVVLFSAIFYACSNYCEIQQTKRKTVTVVAKQEIYRAGNGTRWVIAFSDGDSEICDFGEYSRYNVGDTVNWVFLDNGALLKLWVKENDCGVKFRCN